MLAIFFEDLCLEKHRYLEDALVAFSVIVHVWGHPFLMLFGDFRGSGSTLERLLVPGSIFNEKGSCKTPEKSPKLDPGWIYFGACF